MQQEEIKELKSQAYDILAQIESAQIYIKEKQQALQAINQKITTLQNTQDNTKQKEEEDKPQDNQDK